jgi:RNA polymerase sigma factor (TIGR02999 family)
VKPLAVELTRTLQAATSGDPQAADQLLPLLYGELRGLAHSYMNRLADGQTLQTTALVHEAYMRLVGDSDPGWNGRGHFFGAAAQAMRQILVEQARRKAALKRGGGQARVDLSDAEPQIEPPSENILALDEALSELEKSDPRKARLVLLHHFAGLTMAETAAALGISVPTAERDWRFVRTLLFTRLREKD